MNIDNIIRSDFPNNVPVELLSSFLVMLIIIVLSFIIYFKQKKMKPLEKPRGITSLMEILIEYMDKKTGEDMGILHVSLSPYFMCLFAYIFLGFIVGITGIPNLIYLGEDSQFNSNKLFTALPNPFINLVFPLIIGFITWILIQTISIRFKKAKYLKQFVSPIPGVGFVYCLLSADISFIPSVWKCVCRLLSFNYHLLCIFTDSQRVRIDPCPSNHAILPRLL